MLLQKNNYKWCICSSCDHLNVPISHLSLVSLLLDSAPLSLNKDFGGKLFHKDSWQLSLDNSSCTESGELIYNVQYQTFGSKSCKSTATVWWKAVASDSPTAGFGGVFLYNAQVSQLLTKCLSISKSAESLTPSFTKSFCSLSAVACPNSWRLLIFSFLRWSLSLISITWRTSDWRVFGLE